MTLGLFVAGAVALLLLWALDRAAVRVVHPAPRPLRGTPGRPGVRAEPLTIPSHGRALNAWILEADVRGGGAQPPVADGADPMASADAGGAPVVLLTHGWGSSHEGVTDLAHALARRATVVVFDVRGHGANPPEPYVTVRHFRDDVRAASRFVRGRFPGRPLLLTGYSMGAAASVLAAVEDGSAAGVALVACPADVLEVTAIYLSERGLPGSFMVWALRPFWWPRVGGSFRPLTPERRIGEVDVPLLLVHPECDERVPRSHAERLAHASGRPLAVIEGAGHRDVLERQELVALLEEFVAETIRAART